MAGMVDDVKVIAQTHRPWWSLYNGDCVEVCSALPDHCIDYSISSWPFASLYTYSASIHDMGNCAGEKEFNAHVGHLLPQMFRILRPGRLMSIHCMILPTSKVRDGYIGLADFPGHIIEACIKAGFIFHSRVEIWKDPVTAMQRTKALGLLHKTIKKDSCMSRPGISDTLVTFRKPGENPRPVSHDDASFPVSEWQKVASPIWGEGQINATETLQYRAARENEDERHICPLQLEVVRRGVRLWSNPGEVVFSPFGGIGTEPYVAVEMGRRGMAVELKSSYYNLAVKNMLSVEPGAKLKQIGLFGDMAAPTPSAMVTPKLGTCDGCAEQGPVGACGICGGTVS